MELHTKRLILRSLEKNDISSLVSLANNLRVSRYLLKVPYPYTKKDAKSFVTCCRRRARQRPRSEYVIAIESRTRRQLLGVISLMDVDRYQGTATLGYWLGEPYWRQGFMYEAAERVLSFAFRYLKLRRINVSASARNTASNRLIKKLGFAYEGTRRKADKALATGKIHDANIYGLLRELWLKPNSF
ncbi:MAG: GNAT family protein [Kiritimatiellae bacterium]|nr:GNAT family protein [Kiritimatiellia bacterium]